MKRFIVIFLIATAATFGQRKAGPADLEILKPKAGETEVERTRHFKKFRTGRTSQGQIEYRIAGSKEPIHYRVDPFSTRDDDWIEIDLTIFPTPGKTWDAEMTQNGYRVKFWNSRTVAGKKYAYVARYERAGQWFQMAPTALYWENTAGNRQDVPMASGKALQTDNLSHRVSWEGAWGPGVDFRYNLTPDEFFKTVVIRDRDALPKCTLTDTAGLKLKLSMAVAWGTGAEPTNGFAQNVNVSKFGTIDKIVEKRAGIKGRFSFQDSRNRNLWWFQTPKIWDNGRNLEKIEWDMVRSEKSVSLIFSVSAGLFDRAEWTWPISMDTAISEETLTADADDAATRGTTWPAGGTLVQLIDNSVTDHHYMGKAATPYYYTYAVRFQTVPIPVGATITSTATKLSYKTYAAAAGAKLDVHVYGEDPADADADAFADPRFASSTLADTTTADVRWNETKDWADETRYDTPDISAVVQEMVNNANWALNNDMVFITIAWATGGANERVDFRMGSGAQGGTFNCTYTEAGWTHIMNGVPNASIGTINGVAKASVDKVNGVD